MQSQFPLGTAVLLVLGAFFSVPILGWEPLVATVFTLGLAALILGRLR